MICSPRYLVDTVSGRTLVFVERVFGGRAVRCRTLDGWIWVKRLRHLRSPMPGEIRVADRTRLKMLKGYRHDRR
jgi:hypothetical protein